MTAALEGGEWSAARPGRNLSPGKTDIHFTGGWVGPRAGLDGRKISSRATTKSYENKDLKVATLIYTHIAFHQCFVLVCSYFTDATALLNNHRLCESERRCGGNLKYFPFPLISVKQQRFSSGLRKTLCSDDPYLEREMAFP